MPARAARKSPSPRGTYTVVCSDGQINKQGLGTIQGSKAFVHAQSALIIHTNYAEMTK